jgi:hypothetical protein
MDIRKRFNKSNGGNLLLSISEEFDEIQKAITDYKKDFFIDGYEGREDDITAFLYKAQVGNIDILLFSMIFPKFDLTQDINTFYQEDGYAYYEDGYLFFKASDIESNFLLDRGPAKIRYSINGYSMTSIAEKMHVWNVFDEFATFVGLERHEGEKNSDLVRRIYTIRESLPNSSEPGLKNAILAELKMIDENLSVDEIKVERPTPENLRKYYKEFGTVLERLAQFNKDTYRTKKWDIDMWNHDFKSVDYIPHAWDVAISTYQNGIGFGDDLEVSTTDDDDTADATISFFKESDSSIQQYVRDNSIKRNISYEMYKYANALKPENVKYKISASDAKEFTSEDIGIECLTKISGLEQRKIEDIIEQSMNSIKDIEVQNTKLLDDGKYYQIVFTPAQDYGYMKVDSCSIKNSLGTETNLIAPADGYTINADGSVVNSNTKKYASQKHDFVYYSNVANIQQGIVIDDLSKEANLDLDLFGMNSQYIKIQYDSPMSPIRVGYGLTLNNCSLDDEGAIISDTSSLSLGQQKDIQIKMDATNIKFDVSGNYMVTVYINGKQWLPEVGQTSFNLGAWSLADLASEKGKPLTFNISVYSTDDYTQMKISNLSYSCYEVASSLEYGTISTTQFGDVIPPAVNNTNTLHIKMKTYTGYSPILNFVHVGSSLSGAQYICKTISPDMGTQRSITVDTNCKMELREVDSNGITLGTVNSDYQPYYIYKATSDNAYLKITLFEYSIVNSVKLSQGKIETIGTGSNIETYLKLKLGESVQYISIDGDRFVNTKSVKLNEILGIDSSRGDKVYANALLKGIITVKSGQEELVKISQDLISSDGSDNFKFTNIPSYLNCAFVLSEDSNKVIVNDSYTGSFESAYLFPKNSTTYIAFNKSNIVRQEERGIEIIDVFSPFLPENVLMAYLVESMDITGVNQVRFNHDDSIDFPLLKNWSLGRKTLRIRNTIGISNMLDTDSVNVQKEFEIRNTIQLDQFPTTNTGRVVEIAQYIIVPPDDMSVIMNSNTGLPMESEPDFYNTEEIVVEDDGFNKLEYSNIDEIIYIGLTPWSSDPAARNPINIDAYSVMKTEGIIAWNGITPGTTIYVLYSHKIPSALTFIDPKTLYELVEYNIEAYEKIGEITITDKINGDSVNLSDDALFLESDRVTISCDAPGFQVEFNKGILSFKRMSKNNTIAVKAGYYYVDGDEYYCFANNNMDNVDRTKYVELYNVDREFGNLMLNKKANNFIKNSSMYTGGMANTFSINFENNKNIKGVSSLNSITACSSFNHWKTFGTTISIKKGYNGLGIAFSPNIDNGYAYIDITPYLPDNALISMHATDGIIASIGKEEKIHNLSLPDTTAITLIGNLLNKKSKNIIEYDFTKEQDIRYYLVISGSGIIDDIILGDDSELSAIQDLHKKNIDKLELNIEEPISSDYACRLYFDNDKFGKRNGTEITPDGVIINSSLIDWGITRINTIDSNDGWSKCSLTNADIDNAMIVTLPDMPGTLETPPIYVGNINTIKSFIFKINDVEFDNMSNFTTKILACESYNGFYRTIKTSITDNIGYIESTSLKLPYVKLSITIPAGNVIKNIDTFVEYKSDENWAPLEIPVTNGTFTSEILDTFYAANYKVNAISIDSVSNINNVQIQIRGAKEGYDGDVWSPWETIELDESMNVTNNLLFNDYRFFQAMVSLKGQNTYIKINHIDLGVV